MEVLSTRRLASRRAATRLCVVVMVVAGGCALGGRLRGTSEDAGPWFDHRLHVDQEGLACTDCHAGVESADEPGMPLQAQCALCHADLDAEKPPEKQAAALFAPERAAAHPPLALDGEVIFSHLAHVGAGAECASCHAEVVAGERERGGTPAMDDCMACHASSGRKDECATCHREIRADRAPPSHAELWTTRHGSLVRAGRDGGSQSCSLCHTESSCSACHQETMPASHTNLWRLRAHGSMARLDRASCATCHRSDSCDRCHSETEPQSHVGTWGSPLSSHCLSCHASFQGAGCVTCHKSAPSHALALPKPANHTAGMNCLQCHGLTAPLPHLHAGQDCNLCHH